MTVKVDSNDKTDAIAVIMAMTIMVMTAIYWVSTQ
jgi:hypothetical protein